MLFSVCRDAKIIKKGVMYLKFAVINHLKAEIEQPAIVFQAKLHFLRGVFAETYPLAALW